ncbi:MAG: ABC transporter substrate-binding protein [Candidatus Nanopelagicaceae bacterium]|nr:ABC transporter substrate-binding protein [Candidatus Nanopelagicaceae bacterium]
MTTTRFKASAFALIAVSALVLSACSSSTSRDSATSTTASGDEALVKMVPTDVAADGILTFGSDGTYPPNEFVGTDGKTMEGMDIDLGIAIAAKLGLKAEFINAPFDSIIPAIQSGKYEAGISSFTDNKEREQVLDFVTYYSAGSSWAAKIGSTLTPDTACGKNIAVQKGTVQADDITARSKACTDAGKPAITINQYQSQQDATATVISGKNDAMLADSPITGYAVKTSDGQLQIIGTVYDTAPYGVGLPKAKGDFAKAVQGAIAAIIADGTYASILDKYGAADGGVTESVINGAK